MCGIVGYLGHRKSIEVLLDSLEKLEYRGYDSAGVVIIEEENLKVYKEKGRLSELVKGMEGVRSESTIGLGHIRWATHGAPSDINAHPHLNQDGSIAIIHNGIIENYLGLKSWLSEHNGSVFISETDSEVIAHLIDYYYDGDLLDAVYKSIEQLEGAYAIGVISKSEPDRIIAVRKDSPLIVGKGDGEYLIASDIPAVLKYTRDVFLIENGEVVDISRDGIAIYNEYRQPVNRELFHVDWDVSSAEKEGFDHFTLKEIHEQPKGIKVTLDRRLDDHDDVYLEGIKLTKEDLERYNKIYIVACGTAYHAGLIGKYAIEKLAKIPVEVNIASEFRYNDPFIDGNTLFIAVSQSGETLDTLQSLREAKKKGARIMSIVNVVGSSVARESDDVFYTWAGPEIGVASTKAYTTQLASFYLLALYLGRVNGKLSLEEYRKLIRHMHTVPKKMKNLLDKSEVVQTLAYQQFKNEHVFFIGRNIDLNTALEASLKLKELSYINSFAIAAGELKHGTIALIEEGSLIIVLATQNKLYEKIVSNIKEVKARGGYVIAIAQEGNEDIEEVADAVILIPKVEDMLAPILSIISLQLFAYYVSLARGNDIDKPRNLAKSVTVE